MIKNYLCAKTETNPQLLQLQFTGKSHGSEVSTPKCFAQNLIHTTDSMTNSETRKCAFDQLHFYY